MKRSRVAYSLDEPLDTDEGEVERDIPDWSNDPEAVAQSRELQREVQKALLTLSDKLRSVIVLHDLEGLPYEEIAGILDIPLGTVKSRLFNAQLALHDRLGPPTCRAVCEFWRRFAMSCWKVRRMLGDFVDGALAMSNEDARRLHLSRCRKCGALAEGLKRTKALLQNPAVMPRLETSEGFMPGPAPALDGGGGALPAPGAGGWLWFLLVAWRAAPRVPRGARGRGPGLAAYLWSAVAPPPAPVGDPAGHLSVRLPG